MNTIHSSSLAFRPAGYLQPETTAIDARKKHSTTDGESNASLRQEASSSTPGQIQAALETLGLSNGTRDEQALDLRTSKALATYLETRNQPIQAQLSSLVSGIDLYA